MKKILQILGAIFLLHSAAGIVLHALANLETFGHHCEMLLFSTGENHLQVYIATAGIAAVAFLIAKNLKKRQLRKPA